MAESTYFIGAEAIVSVDSVVVAAVSGWEFRLQWQTNAYHGSSSIFEQAVAKFKQEVPIKIKFAKFMPRVGTEGTWFYLDALRGGVAGVDKDGNSIALGKIADSSYVKEFTISGLVSPADSGGVELNAEASGCYFEKFPINVKMGEWLELDLSAKGSDITFTNPT